MRVTAFRPRHLILAGLSTAALAVLVTPPHLLGDRVAEALEGLGDAQPVWLWGAALLFVSMHALAGLSWCVALRAGGTHVDAADAIARYGVGSALNALAPAHLGSAVRVALFTRIAGEGGLWRVGGACAVVGSVRAVWLALLVMLAAGTGVVPAWPLALIALAVVVAGAVAFVARRVTLHSRVAPVLDAFRGLRPVTLLSIGAVTLAAVCAKVLAVAAVLASLGIDNPLRAALVVVPAVELAAVMPITPGNAGVASAAVAFALGALGVAGETALAAGIAFGAVETLASASIGAAGALALAGPLARPVFRLAAAGAAMTAIALTFSVTVVLPVL